MIGIIKSIFAVTLAFLFSFATADSKAQSLYDLGLRNKPISLNFQDMQTQALIDLVADFAGFYVIYLDVPNGRQTIRLQNQGWIEALTRVMRNENLVFGVQGSSLFVAYANTGMARVVLSKDLMRWYVNPNDWGVVLRVENQLQRDPQYAQLSLRDQNMKLVNSVKALISGTGSSPSLRRQPSIEQRTIICECYDSEGQYNAFHTTIEQCRSPCNVYNY